MGVWWWKRRKQWVADVREPGRQKRRRWYLGPDRGLAEAEYHRRMWLLKSGQGLDSSPEKIILADLAERWLEWYRHNRAPRTGDFCKTYISWLVNIHGLRPAASITPQDIEKIKNQRRRSNSPRSINAFVGCCKSLFKWGIEQGFLEEHPIQYVRGVPKAPKAPRALTPDQVSEVLALADRNRALGDYMRVLLYSGLRPGELAGLPWSAYNADSGVLRVQTHKTVGRTGIARVVPVSAHTRAILDRQPRTGAAIFSHEDGRAITFSALRQRWWKLRQKCSRIRQVSMYALRHTHASALVEAGVHPWAIQQLLGHASDSMTKRYVHAGDPLLRDAVERLDFERNPPPTEGGG